MNKFKITVLTFAIALVSVFAACSKGSETSEPQVKYFVDGKEQACAPDRNMYEAVSIESNSKDANIAWNSSSWELEMSNIKGNEKINVYFEYQTHPVTVDGIGFDDLQSAFNYIGSEGGAKRVYLTADVNGAGTTAVGSDIAIEMNGFTIDGCGRDTIINNGKMAIYGAGTITNSMDGEYSKSIVNYGELTLQGITVTNSTSSVCVWNSSNGSSSLIIKDSYISHSASGSIAVINSGNMELVSGSITGCGDAFHPALYNNDSSAVLTLTGGSVDNTSEGYAIYNDGGTIVLGGATYGESYNMPSAE